MKWINGIGGVFIFSSNPGRLARWYADGFGFEFEGSEESGMFYQVLFSLDADEPGRKLDTTFAIMRANTEFFRPILEGEPQSMYGDQPYMINLRTLDLDALLAHLESMGVAVIRRAEESYGKFAWVRDPDGNRIELYQFLKDPDG